MSMLFLDVNFLHQQLLLWLWLWVHRAYGIESGPVVWSRAWRAAAYGKHTQDLLGRTASMGGTQVEQGNGVSTWRSGTGNCPEAELHGADSNTALMNYQLLGASETEKVHYLYPLLKCFKRDTPQNDLQHHVNLS